MNATTGILGRTRLIFTIAILFTLAGLLSWTTMPRQEDPTMSQWWGAITVVYPGADAAVVERLIIDPLEDQLAEVGDVDETMSQASAGVASIAVKLRDGVPNIDDAWDDVRDALDAAARDLPEGAEDPSLEFASAQLESVVLIVGGSQDLGVLHQAAQRLQQGLLGVDLVSQVNLFGEPNEKVLVEYTPSVIEQLGLSPGELAAQLSVRNTATFGGAIRLGRRTASLEPSTEFRTVEELAETPVVLPSGAAVPLREIARIREGAAEPVAERVRMRGQPVVGIGVVATDNVHYGMFGKNVRAEVERLREELAPLTIEEFAFTPDNVNERISGLTGSIVSGVGIVVLVLWAGMGLRMALVVAAVLPVVVLISISIYALGGGILHQMSIAAVVIALGMLVDNAIVVAEDVQRRIDAGENSSVAARASTQSLRVPLGSATGTTLASFLPMLLAPGPTGEFVRAIPIVVIISLSVSYLGALFITPLLASRFLKRSNSARVQNVERAGSQLARISVRRPKVVLFAASLILFTTCSAAGGISKEFFPAADRNTVVISVGMPGGTHFDETFRVATELEDFMTDLPQTRDVATFVGRSAPHFYYNLPVYTDTPHLAQLIVTTRSVEDNAALMDAVREHAATTLLEADIVTAELAQGPPVAAPVEVRLYGDRFDRLREAADQVRGHLAEIPGAVDARDNMSIGSPTIRIDVDDAAAARRGLARADVASTLQGHTRGIPIGQYRSGDDPVPILLRAQDGENTTLDELLALSVTGRGGPATPLSQIGRADVVWRPSVIRRSDRRRSVSVLSEVAPGFAFSQILTELDERVKAEGLPEGIDMSFAGEAQGADDANSGLIGGLPVGLAALVFFLFLQFDSLRRVGIILTTVPLALVGIIPGLLVGNQPFGFMSMLGAMALIGIVVNSAIVLLDVVEQRRREGTSIDDALIIAVRIRIVPIVLTTATTGAGLLPLAFSSTTLWPPMAWAMIAGLFASSILTLIVIPALYRVLFRDPKSPAADADELDGNPFAPEATRRYGGGASST